MAKAIWLKASVVLRVSLVLSLFLLITGCPQNQNESDEPTTMPDNQNYASKSGIKAVPDPVTGRLTCPGTMELFNGWCVPCMPYEFAISPSNCAEMKLDSTSYIDLNHPHAASTCPIGTASKGGRASALVGVQSCLPVQTTSTVNGSNNSSVSSNESSCIEKLVDFNFPLNRVRGWLTSSVGCETGRYAHSFENSADDCFLRMRNQYNSSSLKCKKWFESSSAYIRFENSNVPEQFQCRNPGLDDVQSKDLVFAQSRFFNVGSVDYTNCPAVQFFSSIGTRLKCCNYQNPSSMVPPEQPDCIVKDFLFDLYSVDTNWKGDPFRRIVSCSNEGAYMYPYPFVSTGFTQPYVRCHNSNSTYAVWADIGWWSSEYAGFVVSCSKVNNNSTYRYMSGKYFCCRVGAQPNYNYSPGAVRKTLTP